MFNEYMVRLQALVGIYLVAWFDKAKWDAADRRRAEAPNLTPIEIQKRLDETSLKEIPQSYLVRPVVVDCHAP